MPTQSDTTTQPATYTAQQIATMLNVGIATVWRWRDAGKLPSPVKIGAIVRWRRDDIERWIADGCPDMRGGK